MKRDVPLTELDRYLSERGHGSAADLAEQLGITETYMSDLRLGKAQPRLDLALRIEELTGIPARELVMRDRAA